MHYQQKVLSFSSRARLRPRILPQDQYFIFVLETKTLLSRTISLLFTGWTSFLSPNQALKKRTEFDGSAGLTPSSKKWLAPFVTSKISWGSNAFVGCILPSFVTVVVVVVVGALFTVVNVGGMMDNTSPGCAIPGQPQCLFCRQMCPVLDVFTLSSSRSSSTASTFGHPGDNALLQISIFFPRDMTEIS